MSFYTRYIINKVLIPIFGTLFEYEVNSYFPIMSTTYINIKDIYNNNICVSMNINNDVLHVSLLKKTKYASGNVLIENIKNLAFEMDVPEITLHDMSTIEYGIYDSNSGKYYLTIDLHVLHILLYGESWYNKMGFYMKNGNQHMEYHAHNKKLLQMSMGNLLRIYIKKTNNVCRNIFYNLSCVDYKCSHVGGIHKMKEFVLQYYSLKSNQNPCVENMTEIERENILDTISVREFMRAFKNYKLMKSDMSYITIYMIYLINYINALYYYDEHGNETEPLLKYDNHLTNIPIYEVEGELVMP
jgi:hypothetical protein